MFGGRISLIRYSKRCISLQNARTLCDNSNKTPQNPRNNAINGADNTDNSHVQRLPEAYRDLQNLDFTKAARILFSSDSSKKKKFGLDFHLVQLFFALMPSLAVYLVAQYSRYEMRKMELKIENGRKKVEEHIAKQKEAAAVDEEEPAADAELSKVKERLEVLEETVKEIAFHTKKLSSDNKGKNADQSQERVGSITTSEDKHVSDKKQLSNQGSVQPPKPDDGEKKGSGEDKSSIRANDRRARETAPWNS